MKIYLHKYVMDLESDLNLGNYSITIVDNDLWLYKDVYEHTNAITPQADRRGDYKLCHSKIKT